MLHYAFHVRWALDYGPNENWRSNSNGVWFCACASHIRFRRCHAPLYAVVHARILTRQIRNELQSIQREDFMSNESTEFERVNILFFTAERLLTTLIGWSLTDHAIHDCFADDNVIPDDFEAIHASVMTPNHTSNVHGWVSDKKIKREKSHKTQTPASLRLCLCEMDYWQGNIASLHLIGPFKKSIVFL